MTQKYPTSPKLREALIAHRTEHKLTNTQFSKALDVSPTFLSKYINDKLDHNPKDFDNKAWDMLKALKDRLNLTQELILAPFTKQIHGRIQFIRDTNDLGAINSESGYGKTSAALLYQKLHPTSIYCCLNDRTREGKHVESAIFAAVENRSWKGNSSRWDFLTNRLEGSSRVLLIDNAQRLGLSGLAWLCDFHDATGCPMPLFVQDGFHDRIKKDPALTSRFGISTTLAPGEKEIANVAPRVVTQVATIEQAEQVSDLAIIVALHDGHYRAVRKQALLAKIILEKSKDDQLTYRTAFRMAHKELVRNYDLPA